MNWKNKDKRIRNNELRNQLIGLILDSIDKKIKLLESVINIIRT